MRSCEPNALTDSARSPSPPRAAFVLWLFLAACIPHSPSEELDRVSFEELGDVPAIVSAKLPSQLFEAPTGSYVFGQAEIESLPVDSIAEMLRYAPGVHIIRPSNGIWGIGMRGINSRFFNRVQFTVDEQNVYSLIFAGLFGNQHDLLLDDVSAVEVAYGPGGGTWDNNAVNGRINVLMKTAFETEGALLKSHAGNEQAGLAARIGWAIDETTSARVYARANVRDSSETRFDYSNQWNTARTGFRLDKLTSSRDLISVSTEAFYSDLGYAYNLADFSTGALDFKADAERLRGANAQIKWTRDVSEDRALSLRSWFSYSDLDAPYAAFSIFSAGAEGRSRFRIGNRHVLNLNFGGSYDEEYTDSTPAADWTSDFINNAALYGGFQDEWELIPETLNASFGIDFRYEEKSDRFTQSPNFRLIFQPSDSDRLWISYSVAKRNTPVALTVMESLRSGKAIEPPMRLSLSSGNISLDRNLANAMSRHELDAEKLDAIEFGYRKLFPNQKGSFSLNGFHYEYDGIFARTGLNATPVLDANRPYLATQITYDNALDGDAYGYEASLQWLLNQRVEATLNYSRLIDSFAPAIAPANPFAANLLRFSTEEFDHSTPSHMATLFLSSKLNDDWNLNTGLRYADSYSFAKGKQPSVFQLDAKLTWSATDSLEFSLVGRNLLDSTTQEARLKDFFGHWTEIQREFFIQAKAEF